MVNLRHPKTVDGETYEQLTMRREIAKDSRDAQRGGGRPVEIETRLFANLCEVAPGVIEQLDLSDYQQTAEAVTGFFGKLTRVGDVAATLPAPSGATADGGAGGTRLRDPDPGGVGVELGELYRWTDEAGSLVRRIYGSQRRRR